MIPLHEPEHAAATRIGLVVPSVNTVMEPYAYEVAPPGATFHSARMRLSSPLTPESVERMDAEHGAAAMEEVADCGAAAIAYGCTASSIVGGVAHDRRLREESHARLGVPVTTVMDSVLAGCRALGVTTVALASPYPDEITRREVSYLEESGLRVASVANLGIADASRLCEPGPRAVRELVLQALTHEAEGILISCVNFRGHLAVAALEEELSMPVIAASTATLWHVLRLVGLRAEHHAASGSTLLSSDGNSDGRGPDV